MRNGSESHRLKNTSLSAAAIRLKSRAKSLTIKMLWTFLTKWCYDAPTVSSALTRWSTVISSGSSSTFNSWLRESSIGQTRTLTWVPAIARKFSATFANRNASLETCRSTDKSVISRELRDPQPLAWCKTEGRHRLRPTSRKTRCVTRERTYLNSKYFSKRKSMLYIIRLRISKKAKKGHRHRMSLRRRQNW